jgi:MFS family permease
VQQEGPERVGYRVALASRELRALFVAQLISVSGNSVAAVGLTVLVFRRTGSPFLSSITFAVGFLPYLIGGAFLSSAVDRTRPRRLVTGCDAASAVTAAAMALPGIPVLALLGFLFAIGTLSSVASGSRAALVRLSVSDDAYVAARSILRIASQTAQVGGNAVAGALLIVLSPRGAFLVNAASFVVASAAVRASVRNHPRLTPSDRGTNLGSLQGAGAILAQRPLRRLLLLGWLAPMFSVAPEALAAPYVSAHHGGSGLVGWWLTALPLGFIAGDVAGVRFLTPAWQRRLIAPAAAASFLPYVFFFANPSVPVAIPLLLASGAGGLYGLGLDAKVRDTAPLPLFARTMAVSSAGLMALQGLGFALAGAVAQLTGPATAVGIAGACGLTVVLLLIPHGDAPAEGIR